MDQTPLHFAITGYGSAVCESPANHQSRITSHESPRGRCEFFVMSLRALLCGLMLVSELGVAQPAYPAKPVRYIMPTGASEVVGRLIAQGMTDAARSTGFRRRASGRRGQYRGGARCQSARRRLHGAAPDPQSHTVNVSLYRGLAARRRARFRARHEDQCVAADGRRAPFAAGKVGRGSRQAGEGKTGRDQLLLGRGGNLHFSGRRALPGRVWRKYPGKCEPPGRLSGSQCRPTPGG